MHLTFATADFARSGANRHTFDIDLSRGSRFVIANSFGLSIEINFPKPVVCDSTKFPIFLPRTKCRDSVRKTKILGTIG